MSNLEFALDGSGKFTNADLCVHCQSNRAYRIRISPGSVTDPSPERLQIAEGKRILVVTTPTVERLYGRVLARSLAFSGCDAHFTVLPVTERSKTIEAVLNVCTRANTLGLARRDVIAAFGGGVCTDIVTMAASLYRRGIPYACFPTTLVAQVDAAIGIKGGVNFDGGKNLLGSFYPPLAVAVDRTLLQSLPAREIRCGVAEIVKLGIVCSRPIFEDLEINGEALVYSRFQEPALAADRIIKSAITDMTGQLGANIYEDQTQERLVDFGHTFSPALESVTDYAVAHGEAVAIDMALSSAIAFVRGAIEYEEFQRIIVLLGRLDLPRHHASLTVELAHKAIQAAIQHRNGRVNLVIPSGIGCGTFVRNASELDDGILREALRTLTEALAAIPGFSRSKNFCSGGILMTHGTN